MGFVVVLLQGFQGDGYMDGGVVEWLWQQLLSGFEFVQKCIVVSVEMFCGLGGVVLFVDEGQQGCLQIWVGRFEVFKCICDEFVCSIWILVD